eukprot:TRINITY_DN13424_c0_g1_i2.p1 TRINITY_DN13424_c0_g1~~TRINITY_DN13424_c0_g1_i2.p1  ORF type:complete len:499 (+),score=71.02 TRINITY_DN13424_c0_g1_i2:49-1545(+)
MAPPSPTYKDFHESLKQGLSPRRVERVNHLRSAGDVEDDEEREMSVRRIDRDLVNQPDVFQDADRALNALLVVRDSAAKELEKEHSQTREGILSKCGQQTASVIPPPVNGILSLLSEPAANVSPVHDSVDALPAIGNNSPRRDKLIAYNSLSNSECANINTRNIMSHRPWLTNNRKSEAQAAAAAHLLLYAEGLQNIREHLTTSEGNLKVGSEVTISPEVFSGDSACDIKAGIITSLKGKKVATVHIPNGHADSKRRLEVDIPTQFLRLKTRRIVPLEAIEKWGAQGLAVPSIAAHTQFQSPDSGNRSFPSASDCNHILNVINAPVTIPNHVSSASSKTDGFALGDTSFHVREVAGTSGSIEGDNARYRQLVSMISKSVLVVDNPNVIKKSCDNCYDNNVEPGILIGYCGKVGRVVQINSAAETARLAFENTHLWVPISTITLCNSDPMSSVGCRNTSISVLGNPSKEHIAAAAKAIAKREDEKRKLRKTMREQHGVF